MARCPRCNGDGERITAPVCREDVPVFETWYCRECDVSYLVMSSPQTRRSRTSTEL